MEDIFQIFKRINKAYTKINGVPLGITFSYINSSDTWLCMIFEDIGKGGRGLGFCIDQSYTEAFFNTLKRID